MSASAPGRAWLGRLRALLEARDPRERTGVSGEEWRQLQRLFPALGRNPGPRAARRRLALDRFAGRGLETGRWEPIWEGPEPALEPAVYVTGHLGALQSLRYVLRSRGVAAANVLGRFNLDRALAVTQDRRFDRWHPLEFPHALPAAQPHVLRRSLRSGSLILAADWPERGGVEVALLGGRARLDPRPFRLSRLARVRCYPVFLTAPRGAPTLTLGCALPAEPDEALAEFARAFAAVAARSPQDLDGVMYRALYGNPG